jgi:cyclopropane fatty-acyl-phospholipid synthase-like methyltransferase
MQQSNNSEGNTKRKSTLSEGFNARSSVYQHAPWLHYPSLLEEPLNLLELAGEESVLEIGIGTGVVSEKLKNADGTIVGMDLSEKMLEQAAQRVPRHLLLKFDAEKLTEIFLHSSFDAVLSRNLLTHVDIQRVLSGAYNVLKPNGKLLLVEACALHPDDTPFFFKFVEHLHPGHVSYPTYEQIVKYVQTTGFVVGSNKLVKHSVSLSGYLTSIADRRKDHLDEIYRLFRAADTTLKERNNFIEQDDDILFSGCWAVILARKPI